MERCCQWSAWFFLVLYNTAEDEHKLTAYFSQATQHNRDFMVEDSQKIGKIPAGHKSLLHETDRSLDEKMSYREVSKQLPALAPGPPPRFAPQSFPAVVRPKKNSTACSACKTAKRKVSCRTTIACWTLLGIRQGTSITLENLADCGHLHHAVFWDLPLQGVPGCWLRS
jgi:hypothetical protein